MNVGFIGLGSMGAPIARRLARSGFAVTGCDVFPASLGAFDEPGTTREADPVECARGKDFVGVCVRTDTQVEDLCADGRLFAAMAPGGIFILHSTVAPDLARRLAADAAAHGVGFIDVGVSGGAPAAIEGKLSLFVGGEDDVVARARPFLDAIGTVSHLGPVGRGLEGKLLNNLVSIANYGMSTAILDIGMQLNFDREQLQAALMGGSGQSFALRVAPSFMGLREGATAQSLEDMHDLLKKDVDHSSHLVDRNDPAMAALLAACEALLARIKRAAADKR